MLGLPYVSTVYLSYEEGVQKSGVPTQFFPHVKCTEPVNISVRKHQEMSVLPFINCAPHPVARKGYHATATHTIVTVSMYLLKCVLTHVSGQMNYSIWNAISISLRRFPPVIKSTLGSTSESSERVKSAVLRTSTTCQNGRAQRRP